MRWFHAKGEREDLKIREKRWKRGRRENNMMEQMSGGRQRGTCREIIEKKREYKAEGRDMAGIRKKRNQEGNERGGWGWRTSDRKRGGMMDERSEIEREGGV